MNNCDRCKEKLKQGIALENRTASTNGRTYYLIPEIKIINCLKCPRCGESYGIIETGQINTKSN